MRRTKEDFRLRTCLYRYSNFVVRRDRKENKTAILVTHDLSEAISLSDKIIVLSNRPARVVKVMNIDIPCKEKGSLATREHPKFGEYFQILWKEMNPPDERSA